MALVAYFDSNVWIALFYGEPATENVEALIKEIKADKGVIITSIITLTEITIHAHRKDPSRVRAFQQMLNDLSSISRKKLQFLLRKLRRYLEIPFGPLAKPRKVDDGMRIIWRLLPQIMLRCSTQQKLDCREVTLAQNQESHQSNHRFPHCQFNQN